jgi:hypothetical protein
MYLLTVCLFTKILTFHVLFKHGILWIVLSFTNETVSDGSSVAFSEIAATTEVSTLLKAFGLDVQRHVKVSKVVKCNEK